MISITEVVSKIGTNQIKSLLKQLLAMKKRFEQAIFGIN